jgi:glutamate synthase (NADPH/NADH) small chain
MVVIGGGDTSTDCLRTAARLQVQHGFEDGLVVNYYRGNEIEMRAREDDCLHAKEEGIHYEFLASPVRFIGDDHGHVRQIEFVKIMTKPADQPEQKIPSRIRIPIPGQTSWYPADVVVLAIGYSGDELILRKNRNLRPASRYFRSAIRRDRPRHSGRVLCRRRRRARADLVVTAIAAGVKPARGMEAYLQSLSG